MCKTYQLWGFSATGFLLRFSWILFLEIESLLPPNDTIHSSLLLPFYKKFKKNPKPNKTPKNPTNKQNLITRHGEVNKFNSFCMVLSTHLTVDSPTFLFYPYWALFFQAFGVGKGEGPKDAIPDQGAERRKAIFLSAPAHSLTPQLQQGWPLAPTG